MREVGHHLPSRNNKPNAFASTMCLHHKAVSSCGGGAAVFYLRAGSRGAMAGRGGLAAPSWSALGNVTPDAFATLT